MNLYHFTSLMHWPLIINDGFLRRTESNIGSGNPRLKPYGEHVGPDVVWLTDLSDPTPQSCGLVGIRDKTRLRITVKISDAKKWPDFAAAHGINKRWYRLLGRGGRPQCWWVVERIIPQTDWIAVDERGPHGWQPKG